MDPQNEDQGGLLAAFAVRVTGARWTHDSMIQRALVRRLGGFVELTEAELQPRPDDGMIISSETPGTLRLRTDGPADQKQITPDQVQELAGAAGKWAAVSMQHFPDSRAVPDDLVRLCAALQPFEEEHLGAARAKFQTDTDFHEVCMCLQAMVREGRLSVGDVFRAAGIVAELEKEQGHS